MIDLVKLNLMAGDGGHGRVSLHREKFQPKGGPDGGHGGAGGDIIVRGDKHLNTLRRYAGAKVFAAEDGQVGGKNSRRGRQGQDLVLTVPLGTVVWLLAENKISQFRRQKHEKPDWQELDQADQGSQSLTQYKGTGAAAKSDLGQQVQGQENQGQGVDMQVQPRPKSKEAEPQSSEEQSQGKGGRYRLHVELSSDQVGHDKYYLQAEGESIPYYHPDPLQPLDWSQVSTQAETKVFHEVVSDAEESDVVTKEVEESEVVESEAQPHLATEPSAPEQQSRFQDSTTATAQVTTERTQQTQTKFKALKLVEIHDHGQEVVLCQGGFGGRGNESFKSSTHQTPLEAEYGTPGEHKSVLFELRLLADVGLVGLPNAGKSTFLSRVTGASPKIGSYPFTTLEPNLGVMMLEGNSQGAAGSSSSSDSGSNSSSDSSSSLTQARAADDQQLVLADIPGLIKGASQGRGLGDQFLRHITNCQMLAFVLFLPEAVVFDQKLSVEQKARYLWDQYQQLRQELKAHHPDLLSQVNLLILNKIDLYTKELIDTQVNLFKQYDKKLHLLSTATGQGLKQIKKELFMRAKQVGIV